MKSQEQHTDNYAKYGLKLETSISIIIYNAKSSKCACIILQTHLSYLNLKQ